MNKIKGITLSLAIVLGFNFIANFDYVNADSINNPFNAKYANQLNNNGKRNWELLNYKPLVQKVNNDTITYSIDTSDPFYAKAYKAAIKDWQNLGVLKFVQTDSNNAQIHLTGNLNDVKNSKAYGNTTWTVNNDSLNNKNINYAYLENVKITLSGHLVKNTNWKNSLIFVKNVAEHEIGHALGFAHDDSVAPGYNDWIMSVSTRYRLVSITIPLGNYEKETLLMHYAPQLDRDLVNRLSQELAEAKLNK